MSKRAISLGPVERSKDAKIVFRGFGGSVAKDEGTKRETPAPAAAATREPTRSVAARRGDEPRRGDAGWVCSCVAGNERVRSVRVFANVSSRVSVGARRLAARRAVGAGDASRVTLAAARAAVFV